MSLVATMVQSVVKQNARLDKNMWRPSRAGALDFFIRESRSPLSLLSEDTKREALGSMGKVLKAPVLAYDGNVQVASSRSCVVADAENTSALVEFNFVTYAVGFTMVPAAYTNNHISREKDFSAKLFKITNALVKKMDEDALAALAAAKTQVFADALGYDTTGNVLSAPFAGRVDMFGDINPIMEANDYNGRISIIGNTGVDSIIRKLAQLGPENQINKWLEYADKDFFFTNNVVNEAGQFATFYAVENGNVDLLTRVDREAFLGARSIAGHEWDIVRLPGLDIPVGAHYYEAVGDQSSIAGAATADLTCARKEFYGFSVDVAYVTAYNSDPANIANPIIKGQIASGVGFGQPVVVTNGTANPVVTKAVQ